MNTSSLKNHDLVPDINSANSLGLQERTILMQIMGPQPRLDYPTEPLEMANGCIVEKYIVPDADKAAVLEQLYPFLDAPSLDTVLLDLHTDSKFTVRDFLAIREGDLNFLAAPRYAEAGGTVLDWIGRTGGNGTDAEDKGPAKSTTISTRIIKGRQNMAISSCCTIKPGKASGE